jgi:hypothetical protein
MSRLLIWLLAIVAYLCVGVAFAVDMSAEMKGDADYGREISQAFRESASGSPLTSTAMRKVFFVIAVLLWPAIFGPGLIASLWDRVRHP